MASHNSTALPATIAGRQVHRDGLLISIATDVEVKNEAQKLTHKAYAKMGYAPTGNATAQKAEPPSYTIVARAGSTIVGTLTLGLDTASAGLKADEIFSDMLARYRTASRDLCEITKFAIAPDAPSRSIQREMFKYALELALHCGRDVAVIEVNPRHVSFYKKLGFEALPETRHNQRVDAPAVLQALDLTKGLNERMAS